MVSDTAGGALAELNLRLRLSVKEAAGHRNEPEVLKEKVSRVVENLLQLTAAARGEALLTSPVDDLLLHRERPDGEIVASATDPAAYDEARGRLLEEAEGLVKDLRRRYYSKKTIRKAFGGETQESTVHRSEKAFALGFEIASYVTLRDAEAVGRKGASLATLHSSKEIRAAVKIGQYLLGPSPLTVANDLTTMLGDAVRNINADNLKKRVDRVFEAVRAVRSLESPHRGRGISSPKQSRRRTFVPRSSVPPARTVVEPPPPQPDPPSPKSPRPTKRPSTQRLPGIG
ncbi:hypothetical protein [Streptomyces sp. NPDC001100]